MKVFFMVLVGFALILASFFAESDNQKMVALITGHIWLVGGNVVGALK